MNISEKQAEQLVRQAREARESAYAVYSGFPVGAAVLSADGRIFTGCNVENRAFGAGICAERAAMAAAVTAGVRKFAALAVISEDPAPCRPCGICRQFLSELCDPDMPVLACRADGTWEAFTLDDLLPYRFDSALPGAAQPEQV